MASSSGASFAGARRGVIKAEDLAAYREQRHPRGARGIHDPRNPGAAVSMTMKAQYYGACPPQPRKLGHHGAAQSRRQYLRSGPSLSPLDRLAPLIDERQRPTIPTSADCAGRWGYRSMGRTGYATSPASFSRSRCYTACSGGSSWRRSSTPTSAEPAGTFLSRDRALHRREGLRRASSHRCGGRTGLRLRQAALLQGPKRCSPHLGPLHQHRVAVANSRLTTLDERGVTTSATRITAATGWRGTAQ